MILEKFQTDKYDNCLVFTNPDITLGELKRYIVYQCREFEKSNVNNVILFGDDYFNFAVNFFSAAFTGKEIYLIECTEREIERDCRGVAGYEESYDYAVGRR